MLVAALSGALAQRPAAPRAGLRAPAARAPLLARPTARVPPARRGPTPARAVLDVDEASFEAEVLKVCGVFLLSCSPFSVRTDRVLSTGVSCTRARCAVREFGDALPPMPRLLSNGAPRTKRNKSNWVVSFSHAARAIHSSINSLTSPSSSTFGQPGADRASWWLRS